MPDNEVREGIINTVQALLAEGVAAGDITVRQVAAKAGVGIGTISYHFHSKEKLIYEAIGRQMAAMAAPLADTADSGLGGRERLRRFLMDTAELACLHEDMFRSQMSYDIVHGDFSICYTITPMLREILGSGKSDLSIKLKALEIIATLQMIYLKPGDFMKYAGLDVRNPKQRNEAMDTLLNNVLG
jgi:AcrR family transcriptional regulator